MLALVITFSIPLRCLNIFLKLINNREDTLTNAVRSIRLEGFEKIEDKDIMTHCYKIIINETISLFYLLRLKKLQRFFNIKDFQQFKKFLLRNVHLPIMNQNIIKIKLAVIENVKNGLKHCYTFYYNSKNKELLYQTPHLKFYGNEEHGVGSSIPDLEKRIP